MPAPEFTMNHIITDVAHPYGVFKDQRNRWRTQSLFLDRYTNYRLEVPVDPVYTLRRKDYTKYQTIKDGTPRVIPSFPRLYLELEDPTEYEVAIQLFGGWDHWQLLLKCSWFMEVLEPLREELEVRLRSKAVRAVVKEAESGSKSALSAARAILGGEHRKDKKHGRGRPSKEEVAKEARIQAEVERRHEEDAERIGLVN